MSLSEWIRPDHRPGSEAAGRDDEWGPAPCDHTDECDCWMLSYPEIFEGKAEYQAALLRREMDAFDEAAL